MAAHIFIILIAIFATPVISKHVQFFRKDYTYSVEFDAFYKVHLDFEGYSWSKAFMACENEGAKLFYPKAAGEWSVAKNLIESTNITTSYAIVGIRDEFGLNEFIADNGEPAQIQIMPNYDSHEAQCVLMNMDSGIYIAEPCSRTSERKLAFICRKIDEESCPTIDRGYKYSQIARKCYKLNKKVRSWPEAWQTCVMEGASLAVVSNRAEADVLEQLMPYSEEHFVGYRKMTPFDVFYSVKGNLMTDEYQLQWASHNREGCGTLYRNNDNLYRSTEHCTTPKPFICEMELESMH